MVTPTTPPTVRGLCAPPCPETAVAPDPAAPAPLREKPLPALLFRAVGCFVLVWAGTALPWNDIHSCGGTAPRPRWGGCPDLDPVRAVERRPDGGGGLDLTHRVPVGRARHHVQRAAPGRGLLGPVAVGVEAGTLIATTVVAFTRVE